jgi:hypothetical protein
MSATQDHTLSPAHGHLNLIGFVVMTVFGTFYALSPGAAASRLAAIHYWLSLAAVLIDRARHRHGDFRFGRGTRKDRISADARCHGVVRLRGRASWRRRQSRCETRPRG